MCAVRHSLDGICIGLEFSNFFLFFLSWLVLGVFFRHVLYFLLAFIALNCYPCSYRCGSGYAPGGRRLKGRLIWGSLTARVRRCSFGSGERGGMGYGGGWYARWVDSGGSFRVGSGSCGLGAVKDICFALAKFPLVMPKFRFNVRRVALVTSSSDSLCEAFFISVFSARPSSFAAG